jgi:MFS transporter, ACS family, tartrate transporter
MLLPVPLAQRAIIQRAREAKGCYVPFACLSLDDRVGQSAEMAKSQNRLTNKDNLPEEEFIMASDIESVTIRKVAWRLLPFIFLLYFWCLIDRVNLSYAALTMNADLGLTATMYSLGASIFFIGYFVLEVPSNLILERFGARLWIARIMVTWGLVSSGMAFITGEYSFLTLRFLLGLAEAGFFPGMVLYLTFWFPAAYRARVVAAFMLAVPLNGIIGAPLATTLMQIDAWGLKSWQWLFLLEGIPSIFLGFFVLVYMTDRPSKAHWLNDAERNWLEATLQEERGQIEAVHSRISPWRALIDPRVLTLCAIYFGIGTVSYGIAYFLPQIIRGIGLSVFMTGFVAAIPAAAGAAGMVIWGWFSDRTPDRRWSCGAALMICTIGVVGVAWLGSTWWVLIPAAILAFGLDASRPLFWALPPMFLSGAAAAAGIALINSVGNLGGIVGPVVIGWVKDASGSFAGGLYFIAVCTGAAALLVVLIGPRHVAANEDDGLPLGAVPESRK